VTIRERLKSRRVQKVDEPPKPPVSNYAVMGGWAAPDPADVPSEGDQRRAGAAALANAERPEAPMYATHTVNG
jgi:hypothetical protein